MYQLVLVCKIQKSAQCHIDRAKCISLPETISDHLLSKYLLFSFKILSFSKKPEPNQPMNTRQNHPISIVQNEPIKNQEIQPFRRSLRLATRIT